MRSAIIIIGCIFLLVTGCRNPGRKAEPAEVIRVKVIPVTEQAVSLPIHTSGKLVTRDEIKLSFKTGGIIAAINVREGDKVRKGEILASLNLLEIKANEGQAKVAYDKALRDFSRADTLYSQGSLALEKKQNAETALEMAGNNLQIARFNLLHSKIEAPEDGIIMKQFARENELVAAGYPVFLFGTSGKTWKVEVSLADRDIIRVNRGDSAIVTFDAYPGVRFRAAVDQVGEMSDPYTGTYETELKLNDMGYRLVSGFVGTADIFTPAMKRYSIIPVASIVEADGMTGYIYVPGTGNTVRKIRIGIAALKETSAAVTGIPAGITAVVSEGMAYLRDGASVEIIE